MALTNVIKDNGIQEKITSNTRAGLGFQLAGGFIFYPSCHVPGPHPDVRQLN